MTKWDARGARARAGAAMVGLPLLGLVAACAAPAEEPARAVLAAEIGLADEIGPAPVPSGSTDHARPWDPSVSRACAAVVGRGLRQVGQSRDAGGVTSVWAAGRRWAACDVARGADPVVVRSAGGGPGIEEQDLRVTGTQLHSAEGPAVRYVAAGMLPGPVGEVTYGFPDGGLARARLLPGPGERTWWVVVHTATEGPLATLASQGQDAGELTVSLTGGAAQAFRMPWREAQRSE